MDGFGRRSFKGGFSGGFLYTTSADTGGANAQMLLCAVQKRMHALQVGIPPPAPGVVGVADDVAVVRGLTAKFALQCHGIPIPN